MFYVLCCLFIMFHNKRRTQYHFKVISEYSKFMEVMHSSNIRSWYWRALRLRMLFNPFLTNSYTDLFCCPYVLFLMDGSKSTMTISKHFKDIQFLPIPT